MNLTVEAAEQRKYDDVWRDAKYRVKCHSLMLWDERPELFPDFDSVLDIGCGTGRLFGHLCNEGYDAHAVDISAESLDASIMAAWGDRFVQCPIWEMPLNRRYDLGLCTDVMEHIPEEMVPASLARIREACDVVLFKIAMFPSNYLGHQLHMTIRPSEWWVAQMEAHGGLVELFDARSGKPEFLIRWTRED